MVKSVSDAMSRGKRAVTSSALNGFCRTSRHGVQKWAAAYDRRKDTRYKRHEKAVFKALGSEVYALAPEQLKVFASSGYEVPTPEAVIADAGAIRIVPPAGKRAYAVFKFTTGAFVVRTSAETMTMQEVGTFVGEVVQAAIVCKLAENADPDRPKPEASGGQIASAVAALTAAIRRATGEAHAGGDQAAAESPEVTE